ncbi:GTP 3',8-cyclase MoaA [Cyclobacteriaceae bacterium]|jgi:molybdenum cofactor biosynthesis protein A|nr:GTP 3',8-cyclase MoaA [Cyclobacteriaceae bacterium]MDB4291008.1 GTP 3',8-cyclase MoaA [Cyclobacteriaceae bacterium]MDB4314842.1 GTP 3',8-cyclase MoaA [Cyclobacteriaceae bacterium]MDB4603037.1 GTP 3',8-cyclase MoaA [Cyclobacteriaceae bacterium]MDB4742526.1 GTP 3',8-cyclase MoaA [Cyclobacteriaceae bacterium]
MLIDNHGREINYLRLAVTDRCNLRCFYCMPENGIKYMNRKDLLSFEEMTRLIRVFGDLGVSKIRITGGEPFVRKGIMSFLKGISELETIKEINITTNGTFTVEQIPALEKMGIKSVNLSLDSLDSQRFFDITRRDLFDQVMTTYRKLVDSKIRVKTNMVVMDGRNIEDIYPMLELTKYDDVSVRFIEEMPFNGTEGQGNATIWPAKKIMTYIEEKYTHQKMVDPPASTSLNYKIPGYVGSFGIIPAYTRTFCGSCNRIRLTPQGTLRTCLYGEGQVNFRDLIRGGVTDEVLGDHLIKVVGKRAKDGFEAEKSRSATVPVSESMATIGG